MSMSANLHGVTPALVDVAVHESRTVAVMIRSGADHVTLFPASSGPVYRQDSVARRLATLARLGDEIARQARGAAHDHRTDLRTAQFSAAVETAARRRLFDAATRTARTIGAAS